MSQKFKQRISLDHTEKPKKGYRHDGSEGYTSNNDFVFSGDIEAWSMGKYRRFSKKSNPSLF